MTAEQAIHIIVDSGTITPATTDVLVGAVNETAPATDTASSGLNGRLQRIAQRITSLIALLPAALGQGTLAQGLRVALASDQRASLGAANLVSSQAAPTGASTTIAVARATRVSCTVVNTGSVTCFVGETTATTSMGRIPPGGFVTLTTPALIAGITASGTAAIDVFDEYN